MAKYCAKKGDAQLIKPLAFFLYFSLSSPSDSLVESLIISEVNLNCSKGHTPFRCQIYKPF